MDIIFMGSPDFAVPSLIQLANNKKITIKGVVTQPDRKRGRGQRLKSTPIKSKAQDLGLKVYTEKNINNPDFIEKLKEISPEAIVVVAFGQKLDNDILTLPPYGCINLHASLLPEYRGACPVHMAIINGDKMTGVTTIFMDEGWDTGDIIYKKEVPITRKDTVGSLHDKLAKVGAELLEKTVVDVKAGTAPRKVQEKDEVSYACKFNKNIGKINWQDSAENIYNLVRGVNPWPGAYTKINGDLLKIWEVEIINPNKQIGEAGLIIKASIDEGLMVQCGQGVVNIKKLQLAGRKRMPTGKFLCGYEITEGQKLG